MSPFTSLSREPFEAHSREGITRVMPAQWSHMQLAEGSLILGTTVWMGFVLIRSEAKIPSQEVENTGSNADQEEVEDTGSNIPYEFNSDQASVQHQEEKDNSSRENKNNV